MDPGKSCKRKGCGKTLIGLGVVVAAGAIVFGTLLPSVITKQIKATAATCDAATLQKEAFLDQYGDCADCTPYYYNLNMLNVTNAMEYLTTSAKLKVTEIGPYAYRRRLMKVDVKLSDDTSQISYKQYTFHAFDATQSCSGCAETDEVVSWDVGYLNVISQSGGELGFLRALAAGTMWGRTKTEAEREVLIQANKQQMMRWVNGINSNQPTAWKTLGATVMGFLGVGPSTIASLDLSGFEYNGLFARRPIADWALGYPSMLAGIGLGSFYIGLCKSAGGLNERCAVCTPVTCPTIWYKCVKCATGAAIVAMNPMTCGRIVAKYAAAYGADQTAAVQATCDLCATAGVCAAPLPGAVETSGFDYSTAAPDSSLLNTYIQRTGCDDETTIGEYIQYNGFTTQAMWTKLDSRRNPTLLEIITFGATANCAAPTDGLVCIDVHGNDGTSTPPGGASISGFPSKVAQAKNVMYLYPARQNVSIANTAAIVEIDGVKLTRFIPPNDMLSYTELKAHKGTAYPVDGVHSMAFSVGFLAYLSYPMFVFGDESLQAGVEITMCDGKIASKETLYAADGSLKSEYYDRYQSLIDYEPATGKLMRVRMAFMVSYAIAKSLFTPNAPMSDVVWPTLTAEVVSPAYYGYEGATITSSRLKTFKPVKAIAGSTLPVLIGGAAVGALLVAYGVTQNRKLRNPAVAPAK